jgi:phage baseplate assembly protein V
MQASLERLYRRLLLVVGRGRVKLVDDAGSVQRLQAALTADELHDRLPRLMHYGFSSNPPPGSDCVALFVGGDRSNGVSIADGHQASRPKNLTPGEVQLYDLLGKFVFLRADGTLHIKAPRIVIEATNELYELAGVKRVVDVHGYAEALVYDGGAALHTETWHVGATVTGTPDHGFAPPRVETP